MIQKINVKVSGNGGASANLLQTMQICVSDNLADFADVWPRSDNLRTAKCFAFQCADILEVWIETIGLAKNSKNHFIAILDKGSPIMLLCLGIELQHGIRILKFLDGGVCDYNCPILYPRALNLNQEIVSVLWTELRRVLPSFDVAIFDKMPSEISGISNPLMNLGTMKYPQSGYLASISGNWEEFAKTRLSNRQDSRRQLRKLSELGEVEFAVAETKPQYDEMFAAMVSQKSRKYLETRGANGFDRPGYRRYFAEVTNRLAVSGPVHLSGLKLNNEVIAAHWGLIADKRFYFLMPSYDSRWSRYSPGRLLMEDLIRWCFEHSINFFDFGIGDEPYKLKFCDRVIPLYECVLPVTIKGHAYAIFLVVKRILRKTKLADFIKTRVLNSRTINNPKQ